MINNWGGKVNNRGKARKEKIDLAKSWNIADLLNANTSKPCIAFQRWIDGSKKKLM